MPAPRKQTPDPYCQFKDDELRRRALATRERWRSATRTLSACAVSVSVAVSTNPKLQEMVQAWLLRLSQ